MRGLSEFLSNWHNYVALIIIGLFIMLALTAPVLSPTTGLKDPMVRRVGSVMDSQPKPPSAEAPFGTLPGQIDIYHALVWGSRAALFFGLAVVSLTALFGSLVGATSAYLGGWFNRLVMSITDAFLAFPVIAAVLVFKQVNAVLVKEAGGWIFPTGEVELPLEITPALRFFQAVDPVMIAFILFSWMPYARLVNAMVLRIRQMEFVQAARALGASHLRLIVHHLLPNAITPAVVLAARDMGGLVLLQATFTFIGMGGKSVWGNMLVLGRDWVLGLGGNVLHYWWAFVPATLALVLFGVGWNMLGDGLNEWLDPHKA